MTRTFLLQLVCALAFTAPCFGQEYPEKPVRIIVPLGAGGPTDTVTRVVANALAAPFGTVVVENHPGAEGTLGMSAMLRAPADGYTLAVLNNSSGVTGPALMEQPPYDPVKDLTPIGCMARFSMFMIGTGRSSIASIAELIAAGRAAPNSLNWAASSGDVRVAGEYFNDKERIQSVRIPFDSEPNVVNAVLSGNAAYGFVHGSTILGYRSSDQLRILSVIDGRRDVFFPDVPTLTEAGGPAFTMPSVAALAGPKDLPAPIVERLNSALKVALSDADVRKRLSLSASSPWICTPSELQQWVVGTRAFVDPLISKYHIGKQ
jgi:tripartite-type tricarboxylate transporter receptor subunit TctC